MNAFDFQSPFGLAASNEVSWADWKNESKAEQLAKGFQGCQVTQCWREKPGFVQRQQPATPAAAHRLGAQQSQRLCPYRVPAEKAPQQNEPLN